MTLQDDVGLLALGHFAGLSESFVAVGRVAFQAVELFGVRGEDDFLGQLHEPCSVVGQHVEGVGIGHYGALRAPQLGNECNGGGLVLSESGTDAQGIVFLCIDGFREDGVFTVELYDGLGDGDLQYHVVTTRGVDRHLAGTGTQTGLGGKDGGACHAVAAGNEQGIAHAALVGIAVAPHEQGTYLGFLDDVVLGVSLTDALGADSDVKHAQLTDIRLVLREEECELGLLQGERQVGLDDVGTDVVGVVLAHQS